MTNICTDAYTASPSVRLAVEVSTKKLQLMSDNPPVGLNVAGEEA